MMTYGKKGIFVRLSYLLVAIVLFWLNKIRKVKKSGVLVICYHGVKDSQKDRFYNQLRMINTRAVASKDIAHKGTRAEKYLPICLTFDDAFSNLLTNVIPFITDLEVPITIFVPTRSLGNNPSWLCELDHPDEFELVLSADEINILNYNSLVCFGSHTVDHPLLSQLKEEEIREQLQSSRVKISEVVGEKITELALPHGDYNEVVVKAAIEAGYERIYTLDPVIYDDDNRENTYLIGRFSVSPDDWPVEFFLTINGAYAWLAQWRTLLNKIRNR